MVNFKSESDLRRDALIPILQRLEEEILDNTELCKKSFMIQEEKEHDIIFDNVSTLFSIQEIPTTTEHIIVPQTRDMLVTKCKFTLKERLQILFKGRLK